MKAKTEIPLKQWLTEQAMRDNVTEPTVARRFKHGHYPEITLRRVNARVMFVQVGTDVSAD